jgi:predicted metalloprotease
MRWKRGQSSDNVIDARGRRFGGGGGLPVKAGLPAILIAVVVALLNGGLGGGGGGGGASGFPDIGDILGQLGAAAPPPAEADSAPADDELEDFMRFVVDDVQQTWTDQFAADGRTYEPTSLVLFTDSVSTGCGNATSAVGPFYCPADRIAYIDLGFYDELRSRFGAPGDFAQAYVIAHEIGHHVQNLLGTSADVSQQQQANPGAANELSVALELQADCYAGVWGHAAFQAGVLDDGDLQEGLDAASAVGDDRIQEQAGVDVNPETWTHGSSEERARWFRTGFDSGDPDTCDTFGSR